MWNVRNPRCRSTSTETRVPSRPLTAADSTVATTQQEGPGRDAAREPSGSVRSEPLQEPNQGQGRTMA